jgi:hypothetical protein
MFLIQRSFLSAMFIPHEDFTPQKYVHSSMRGSAEGGYPLCGVWGPIKRALDRGSRVASPDGGSGRSPKGKIAL